jgi:hypothetical protein
MSSVGSSSPFSKFEILVFRFINWILKYGNQCIDKQANHRYLEIQVISSVGSSSPFSKFGNPSFKISKLAKMENKVIR